MATTAQPQGKDAPSGNISFEVLRYIPEESALHYKFIPLALTDGVLKVGMVNPEDTEARDALVFITSRGNVPFITVAQISESDFARVVEGYKGLTGEVSKALGDIEEEIRQEAKEKKKTSPVEASIVEDAPVTKIVAVILHHATEGNASDIHIEPIEGQTRVRFRVDGLLHTSLLLPASVHDAVVARVKILATMKLDEKRKPQDGRFSATIETRKIDFRVSTLPTYFGEKVVVRILDAERGLKPIDAIGLTPRSLALVRHAIKRPYGLILVTGPTGSGKTTTLYSMLQELDKEDFNIVSLEDPIEYNMQGISQSQVMPEIGYTFANGLRSILRQDPDKIMVGEIRDKETAELAVQAALTGHLVISTLHTNNATGVVPRLVDMGIDPYLIASTLILTMAQRLVSRLCPDSKKELPVEGPLKVGIDKQFADLPEQFRRELTIPKQVYEPVRSALCPSGIKGRLAVFEVLEIDKELENVILQNPGEAEVYKVARQKGMLTMKEDALLKAFEGIIPFGEVNKL
jgi:type IV pilus assembly protein PilB